MKWYFAIAFTIALLYIADFLSAIAGFNVALILVLGTAVWIAIDSKKIELSKYKSGISYNPWVLFIAIALVWLIGFPWYLHVRYKIKNGTAELKQA